MESDATIAEEVRTWDFDHFTEIQEWLGKREGGKYHVDPYYIKRGIGGQKAYLWDSYSKKWKLLHIGDVIFKRLDGTIGHEPRATV